VTGPISLKLENSVINLLVIDHSLNSAEPITQALRTAGFMVQPTRSDQLQDIANLVDVKVIDAILLSLNDTLPDVASVRAKVNTAGKDIPIIALYDTEKTAKPLSILQAGADAAAAHDDSENTLLLLRKELEYRQLREHVRSLEKQLQETEARSRRFLDKSSDAIAFIHEGAHVYANQTYARLFGYDDPDELLGVTLMDLIEKSYHDTVKAALRNTIKTGQEQDPVAITAVLKNGDNLPVSIIYSPTQIDGEPCLQMHVHSTGTAADNSITAAAAHLDSSAKIHTRSAFAQHIDSLLTAGDASGAIYYILLNEHRTISQSLGLEASDVLIHDIAEQLAAQLGQDGLIARIADAVFAVYAKNADPDTASEIGMRLQRAVDDNVSHFNKRLISTKASIGVCLVSGYYQNALDILSHANEACELARQSHSESVVVYKLDASELDQESQEFAVVELIEESIAAGRIKLLYQPIASFYGDSTNRYHVSLQLIDAEEQIIPLNHFQRIAENHQLMLKLDRWAIASALKAIAQRPAEPLTQIFVSLSNNSVDDSKFIQWLESSLQQAGVNGRALALEVAESTAEHYFEAVRPLRAQLVRLKCSFTLSEFASTGQSLRLLENLKPDIVKLNTALIEKISRSRDQDAIKRLAELAKAAQQNGSQIIADNVSTPQQMASIWQYGASMAQGPVVNNPTEAMNFDFSEFLG